MHSASVSALIFLGIVDASTLTPPVLPLVVRNPYLSLWLGNAREEPWKTWPMFWTGNSIGLSVLASVPETSTVYPLLGRAQDSLDPSSKHYNVSNPTYLGAQYDASTTNLSYSIPALNSSLSPVELTLSFLSPVTPTSTLRQAIPASYLTVEASGSFDVSVYIDLNGQWVSGDREADIVWSFGEPDDAFEDDAELKTFRVRRKQELLFTEQRQQAAWGELYFTGPSNVRHQCGTSADLRQYFARHGGLKNEVEKKFRGIMNDEPVFAFSKIFDLSSTNSSHATDSTLFTIAHLQDPVTQYASARGLTLMRPLWKHYFGTSDSLVQFHYHDYHQASKMSSQYAAQLTRDASTSVTSNSSYADIVSLAARQVLGATVFSGTPDNPLLFLKEISSNGNCQTIDVIFPSFPFFLYTQPRWLAYVLEPLLEHMGSGQYPNDYAMHDLGAHFPNLTGHADGRDEYMPVEECGDILIMGLALVNSLVHGSKGAVWSGIGREKTLAEISGLNSDVTPFCLQSEIDTNGQMIALDDQWGGISSHHQARQWLSRHYGLWKQWTGYLVEYSLYPENQLCTDDFAGWLPLMTNLALKGIIGIKAMSELADLMGESKESNHYRNISETYIKDWEVQGMSRDGGRAKLAYHWYGSWTTLYSLFADSILCFHPNGNESATNSPSPSSNQQPLTLGSHSKKPSNFIPQHIYDTQSDWYATVLQRYGLPLDSRHLYTKSDWAFQAAAVASPETQNLILESFARWVNETSTDLPMTDLYMTEGEGGWPGPRFKARPVVGSLFSLLALDGACRGENG